MALAGADVAPLNRLMWRHPGGRWRSTPGGVDVATPLDALGS